MSDYRVNIKVKNNRILEAIEAAGYKTVGAFCSATGLHQTLVGCYVNFKKAPILQDGSWSSMALRLSDALLTTPDDLFSEAQKTLRLKTNQAEKEYSDVQMLDMINDTPEMLMIKHDATEAVHDLLDCLTPREKEVMELRFGINHPKGEDHTLQYVADHFDVSQERIRQIEIKALRKLGNKARLGEFGQKKPEPVPEPPLST
ncbi:MAG: hypothetical protein DRI98_08595, partial [Bacteroidetes bacterium]